MEELSKNNKNDTEYATRTQEKNMNRLNSYFTRMIPEGYQ